MTDMDIVSKFKAMSVGALWRHIATMSIMAGGIWFFAGPIVKPYAAEALKQMLIDQGLSPEDFKKIQEDMEQHGIDLNAIRAGTNEMNLEIDNLKSKINEIDTHSKQTSEHSKQTYDLLKTLIPMLRSEVTR